MGEDRSERRDGAVLLPIFDAPVIQERVYCAALDVMATPVGHVGRRKRAQQIRLRRIAEVFNDYSLLRCTFF